jgi:hypothetical protein
MKSLAHFLALSMNTMEAHAETPPADLGWKVLQLVKTADGWKIASELFTVRSLR